MSLRLIRRRSRLPLRVKQSLKLQRLEGREAPSETLHYLLGFAAMDGTVRVGANAAEGLEAIQRPMSRHDEPGALWPGRSFDLRHWPAVAEPVSHWSDSYYTLEAATPLATA